MEREREEEKGVSDSMSVDIQKKYAALTERPCTMEFRLKAVRCKTCTSIDTFLVYFLHTIYLIQGL